MEEVVQCEVPEHDEHRVVEVFAVLRGAQPLGVRQVAQTRHQNVAFVHLPPQAPLEIHRQQKVVGVVKSIEEEPMYVRQVARMLVGRLNSEVSLTRRHGHA